MMRLSGILIAVFLAAGFASDALAAEKVLYNKKSLYRNITVTDDGEKICMMFASRGYYTSMQSCQYKDDPDKLVFDYTKLSMAGLLLNPNPERILVIGLGGGSLPEAFHSMFPEAKIDAVEIDEAVVDVAERYFNFEEGDNTRVIVKDARVYVKQAGMFGRQYDYIILDAFNGDYIPEHLMTKEWLEEVKRLLADDGVLIANTFSVSRLYHNESVTYEEVFGWIRNVKQESGNRLILTGKFDPVSQADMIEKAKAMPEDKFEHLGITPMFLAENFRDERDWNEEARVLTDQYAPVNLLNSRD
ncbi:MAG: fused MFS/spermidine synthase [Gammaproteobacteria bacterium]|nr:fused MFS/spermidine synthase [Gammaproteobacteria bacterium]